MKIGKTTMGKADEDRIPTFTVDGEYSFAIGAPTEIERMYRRPSNHHGQWWYLGPETFFMRLT